MPARTSASETGPVVALELSGQPVVVNRHGGRVDVLRRSNTTHDPAWHTGEHITACDHARVSLTTYLASPQPRSHRHLYAYHRRHHRKDLTLDEVENALFPPTEVMPTGLTPRLAQPRRR
jgi:hypothetical protein